MSWFYLMNAYNVHVQMNYQRKHFIVLLNTTDILFRLRWTPEGMGVYLLRGPRTPPWLLWVPGRSFWCRCWGTPPISAESWRREPRPVFGRFSHTFFSLCHRMERGELNETYTCDLPYFVHANVYKSQYICIFLQVITYIC